MQQERDSGTARYHARSFRSACLRRVVGRIGTRDFRMRRNGKARFNMEFAADEASDAIQAAVLADERSQKWIDGKTPKKIIVVPKKIVNVVI